MKYVDFFILQQVLQPEDCSETEGRITDPNRFEVFRRRNFLREAGVLKNEIPVLSVNLLQGSNKPQSVSPWSRQRLPYHSGIDGYAHCLPVGLRTQE
jgi:hypothetical protein